MSSVLPIVDGQCYRVGCWEWIVGLWLHSVYTRSDFLQCLKWYLHLPLFYGTLNNQTVTWNVPLFLWSKSRWLSNDKEWYFVKSDRTDPVHYCWEKRSSQKTNVWWKCLKERKVEVVVPLIISSIIIINKMSTQLTPSLSYSLTEPFCRSFTVSVLH